MSNDTMEKFPKRIRSHKATRKVEGLMQPQRFHEGDDLASKRYAFRVEFHVRAIGCCRQIALTTFACYRPTAFYRRHPPCVRRTRTGQEHPSTLSGQKATNDLWRLLGRNLDGTLPHSCRNRHLSPSIGSGLCYNGHR